MNTNQNSNQSILNNPYPTPNVKQEVFKLENQPLIEHTPKNDVKSTLSNHIISKLTGQEILIDNLLGKEANYSSDYLNFNYRYALTPVNSEKFKTNEETNIDNNKLVNYTIVRKKSMFQTVF